VKILVIADPHFKSIESFGFMKSNGFDTRTWDKLVKLKNLVTKENPDMLIAAGDLFDSARPSERIRTAVFRLFKSFNIQVVIAAGNHESQEGMMAGSSESYVSDNIQVIPPREVVELKGNIICIGYTRDDELFKELCKNGGKYLISHRDIPSYSLPFEQSFFGHIHSGFSRGNKHSIGALFTDSFGEEGIPCRYLIIDDEGFEFKEIEDIKIRTFNELVELEDGEYDAVRFKLKGSAKDFIGLNRKDLQAKYSKTKIFLEVEVLEEEKKFDETVSIEDTIISHLKEKNLTKEEIKFGVDYFKEAV